MPTSRFLQSRVHRTAQLFCTNSAKTGGFIKVSKSRFNYELCEQSFFFEIRRRREFQVRDYGPFLIVFCNPKMELTVDPYCPPRLAA